MNALLNNPIDVYVLSGLFITLIILQSVVLSRRERLYFAHMRLFFDVLETALLLYYFVYLYRLFHVFCDGILGTECNTVHPGLRRYIAFVVLLIATFTLYKKTGRAYAFIHLIPCLIILPFFEDIWGDNYPLALYASVVCLIIRTSFIRFFQSKDVAGLGFYALSMRDVLSEVDAGILFCRTNGMPVLVNERMNDFAAQLEMNSRINGRKLYEEVVCRAEPFSVDGEIPIIAMTDGTYRMVGRSEIKINRRTFILITATDVTQFVIALTEMENVRKTLEKRQEELNAHLQNILEYTEKETEAVLRNRAHDLLGERLSIILHSIREGHENTDMEKLAERIREAVNVINHQIPETTPEEHYASLSGAFAEMGVELVLSGYIPSQPYLGNKIVDIIREAVTNAVRHAYATKVYIKCYRSPEGFRVSITNNGKPCTKAVQEGNGIRGMRKKVMLVGGVLTVLTQPEFTISVLIPSET